MEKIILILIILTSFTYGEEINIKLVEFKDDKLRVEIKSSNRKIQRYLAVITWNSTEVMVLRNQGFSGFKNVSAIKTIPILPAEGFSKVKQKPTECVWVIFRRDSENRQKLTYLKTVTLKKEKQDNTELD